MEPELIQIKEKLANNGQSFQPFIVAIGSTTSTLQYFVIINDQHYKQKTCLEALSVAIHVFFVFDVSYPENSSSLWLFIQKCLFDIHLPFDRNNISLSVLLGHIGQFKLKQKA